MSIREIHNCSCKPQHVFLSNWQNTQKINKNIKDLSNAVNQPDVTDTYRAFHPMSNRKQFCLSAQETFTKIKHILRHQTNVNIS